MPFAIYLRNHFFGGIEIDFINMRLIDTHAHLFADDEFGADYSDAIARASIGWYRAYFLQNIDASTIDALVTDWKDSILPFAMLLWAFIQQV